MLPTAIIWLKELPLTPNGKLDEKALPAVPQSRSSKHTAPQTPTEKELAAIFATALQIDDLSTEDNFFELGGHSLLATQIIARIAENLEIEITIIDLFDAPTVKNLAVLIDKKLQRKALTRTDFDEDEEREEITF